jgi:N-acetylneuraminic acid mutarotase
MEAAPDPRPRAWIVLAALAACGACGSEPATDAWPPPPGRWEKRAEMPELPRFWAGAATARGRVFVIGGVIPGGFANGPERVAVHAYDPAANTWEKMPPLPRPMIIPNVAAVGDSIYVLGSMDVKDTFAFDFDQRAWVAKKPLPVERGIGGAVVGVWKTTIFLAGGAFPGQSANNLNTGVRVSSLLAYETTRDEWQARKELPVAVGYGVGGVIGDQLWFLGGSTDVARTEQILLYTIPTDTWAAAGKLPKSMSSGAAVVMDGRILITGGIATSVGMFNEDTYLFDPPARFGDMAAMLTPRWGNVAAVLGGRVYVSSGLKQSDDPDLPVVSPELEVFIP